MRCAFCNLEGYDRFVIASCRSCRDEAVFFGRLPSLDKWREVLNVCVKGLKIRRPCFAIPQNQAVLL
jgi:hypothetical protein